MQRFLTGPAGHVPSSAEPKKGPKGVVQEHKHDTAEHTIICTCLSCCGWTPPGVPVLESRPGTAEAYVFVLERKPGTSNVKWMCMGCGNVYTSSPTRMREHVLGIAGSGGQVCCVALHSVFPP